MRCEGENKIGIYIETGKMIVGINLTYYHPVGMNTLLGNASKAREQLGWEVKMSFEEIVKSMITSDWEKVNKRNIS